MHTQARRGWEEECERLQAEGMAKKYLPKPPKKPRKPKTIAELAEINMSAAQSLVVDAAEEEGEAEGVNGGLVLW